MKILTVLLLCLLCGNASAQINCNFYKEQNQTECYTACLKALRATSLQGTGVSQHLFDEAISLCPSLDYAYFEKAVPYLKRGLFLEWRQLIDRAVYFNPIGYLGYRGWCRFQFLRDYRGALEDIVLLDSLTEGNIGYSQNGDYHLNTVRSLCHRALGEKVLAIEVLEKQLQSPAYSPGPYDYLHLGIMKIQTGHASLGLKLLLKQKEINPYLAESHYYVAVAMLQLDQIEDAKNHLNRAQELYSKGYRMTDPYTHPVDKIFQDDITNLSKRIDSSDRSRRP